MIGEVQYGSRVTDDYDKRLLNTYAKVWFGEMIFGDSFEFYAGRPPTAKALNPQTIIHLQFLYNYLHKLVHPPPVNLNNNGDIVF